MLSFEDGYEVAKLMADRFDLTRLREAGEVLERALKAYGEGEGKEFLLGLVEGLGEVARFKEEVVRLQNMAKAMGVSLEVHVKFSEA
mgnify:CR=1 FL=1